MERETAGRKLVQKAKSESGKKGRDFSWGKNWSFLKETHCLRYWGNSDDQSPVRRLRNYWQAFVAHEQMES